MRYASNAAKRDAGESRHAFPSALLAMLLAGSTFACATTHPDPFPDPVPEYVRPEIEPLADPPANDVSIPTPIAQGQLAPGGGVLISTADSVEKAQLIGVVLPACEQSAGELSRGWRGERADCVAMLDRRDRTIGYLERETLVYRAGVVVAVIGGAVSAAAAFVLGYKLGSEP